MNNGVALVALILFVVACDPQILDVGWNPHATGRLYPGTGTGGNGGATGSGTALGCQPGSPAPCYDGPPGTEGVGVCKAGTKICNADGVSYGACTGEVLPKPEDCATPVDDDCDGLAPACAGDLVWSKRFGDAKNQLGMGVAADSGGNAVVTGYLYGTADFGGGPLASAGGSAIFLAKLDSSGNPGWSKRFGEVNPNDDVGQAVAVDHAGNVLMTGYFDGSVDFGGGPLQSVGGENIFVAKLDAAGAHRWSKRFGDASGVQTGTGVATDALGNVIVTGVFTGVVDFGGGPLHSEGESDMFVAKLDAAGNHLWSRRFGDAGVQGRSSVAVDANGNVLLAGYLFGSADLGGGPLVSGGGSDVLVAKLDASGNHVWSRRFGDAENQGATSIAVDAGGDAIITGAFRGSIDFGGAPLTSAGKGDVFVAKLGASGNHVWSRRFGDVADQMGTAIAADPFGNVVLTGQFGGTVDFGGGSLASAGANDAFVAKLDPMGKHLWSKRAGDGGSQAGQGIASDSEGNTLVTGYFEGGAGFGGAPLQSAGGQDVFLVKLAP